MLFFMIILGFMFAGCQAEENEIDAVTQEEPEPQDSYFRAEGIYIGQIDSLSVEIEEAGEVKTFGLEPEVDVSEIKKGSKVSYSYESKEVRPTIQSIEVIDAPEPEILQGEGRYVGRIDRRSVEIEIAGEYKAFSLDAPVLIDGLIEGSSIAFSYRDDEHRPVLLTLEVLEEPTEVENDEVLEIETEGIYIGQIDSQSVEIARNRAFALGEVVNIESIADGSMIAFSYTETAERPTLNYLDTVESLPEGEYLVGTLVGQIDSHSVEIEYEQVFIIGEGVNIEAIESGSEIRFTYKEGPARPVLISIEEL